MMQQRTGRIPILLVCWEHQRATEIKLPPLRPGAMQCGGAAHPLTVITLN